MILTSSIDNSTIKTIFPSPINGDKILVIVSVIDNLGGITNVT